jgi:TetR/AcrR family transcriptional regulator
MGRLNEQVQRACQYQGDLPLTLERITRTYFDFARAEPVFYRLQLSMQFAPPDSEPAQVVTPFILEQHALLEELFVRATRDHGNMLGRQRAYAATLIGMINTYIGIYLAGHGELEDPVVYHAVHQYMHGIFS